MHVSVCTQGPLLERLCKIKNVNYKCRDRKLTSTVFFAKMVEESKYEVFNSSQVKSNRAGKSKLPKRWHLRVMKNLGLTEIGK